MQRRNEQFVELKSFLDDNPPPSVQGLDHTGLGPDEAIDYVREERAKLHHFDNQCHNWIRNAQREGGGLLGTLGYQLRRNYEQNRPSERVLSARDFVKTKVKRLIRARWPTQGFEIEVFGSTSTGLDDGNSDLDLTIIDRGRPLGPGMPMHSGSESLEEPLSLPEWYNVYNVAEVLRRAPSSQGIKNITALSKARTPTVKFSMAVSGLEVKVDLVVNSRLALANTKLINAYCNLQPSLVRPLVYNIKEWLRNRALNDPSARETGQYSLSSYAITLLVIHRLQYERDLPNLQDVEFLENMGILEKTLWTGYDKPRPSSSEASRGTGSGKIAKACDATFFDPSDATHMRGVKILREAESSWTGYRLTSTHRQWETPSSLEDWVEDYEWLRHSDKAYRRLPCPAGAGFYRKEPPSQIQRDRELSRRYQSFISSLWSHLQRDEKIIFDITHGTYDDEPRYVNEEEDRRAWHGATTHSTAFSPIAQDLAQPVEWMTQPLIIQDPFVTDLNVARNMKSPAFQRLKQELRRMSGMLRGYREGKYTNLARLHEPWKLGVVLWEIRERQAAKHRRGEFVMSLFYDEKTGQMEPIELLDFGNYCGRHPFG